VADVVDRLGKARGEMTSFVADSTMDYWVGNQRTKGEVLMMGAVGAKFRLAGLSPAGGSTLAELACDGTNFVLVDYQNNCARSGPCNAQTIAQFFHIALEPDDFIHLALGTPPMVANPTGTVSWDAEHGWDKIDLKGSDGSAQKLTIDAKNNHYDVIASEMVGPDGKVKWSVANEGFVDVGGHRVPGKTRFKSPQNQQDLLVDWGATANRQTNTQLGPEKFKLEAPAGLKPCP